MDNLSMEEKALVNHLGLAWNMFMELQPLHDWERVEFMHGIHALQNMIMARPIIAGVYAEKKVEVAKSEILRV